MTEKRFTIDEKMLGYLGEFVCDNGVRIQTIEEVIDVLNAQHEEIKDLTEENIKLLSERTKDYEQFKEAVELCEKQQKEIEELKSENKELIELIRHCYENWSEEKKKMVGEISNGLLGE